MRAPDESSLPDRAAECDVHPGLKRALNSGRCGQLTITTPERLVPTLDQLTLGQRGQIVEITGDDGIAVRLMEMGLTEGEEIEVLGFAPLGDPIEFRVRGYHLSLRASEARRVVIAG